MLNTILVIASYLLGSVSTAVIVSRCMGLPDPRAEGSGNPGATNVLRLGGKKAAALTLLGDVLKGVVPVLVTVSISGDPIVVVLAALAAFLGHLYPVFFGFKGGKGFATALGAITALSWPVGLSMCATWLLVAIVSRLSSLASLLAALLGPLFAAWFDLSVASVVGLAAISALLLLRHRTNIARLAAGQESRISLRGAKNK
jgi:glycerol-3-phosphate acyltransferase PlsY